MIQESIQLRKFIQDCEQLKKETRHSYLSDGRHESVAEHVWRTSLMALLLRPYIRMEIDHYKLICILVVHDLIEIYAGDVAKTDQDLDPNIRALKVQRERSAAQLIKSKLPACVGENIISLWEEYENGHSNEAKLAHAIDKLEAQLQHNEAGIKTWVPEEFHYAFQLPEHTCQEPMVELIAAVAIDEAQSMLDDLKPSLQGCPMHGKSNEIETAQSSHASASHT
ncbi:MAG: HD domain-containing protein [Lentilitoribacter sp.]